MSKGAGLSPQQASDAWADALVLDAHRAGGVGCRYHLLKNFSTVAAVILEKALGKQSTEYVFIDGLHTYDGVVADIRAYALLVKPGGVMIFSDYGSKMFPGVTKAVDEFVAAHPKLRLDVGAKSKPPGITNAGVAIPLDWHHHRQRQHGH